MILTVQVYFAPLVASRSHEDEMALRMWAPHIVEIQVHGGPALGLTAVKGWEIADPIRSSSAPGRHTGILMPQGSAGAMSGGFR